MYHYTECGLRNVWLANGYEEHETPYGKGVSFHNIEGLHRAIGRVVMEKAGKLTGCELRFLRTEMGLSQARLATILGNEAQTVALWEKHGSITTMADRFVRVIYREHSDGAAHIIETVERLMDNDAEPESRLTMREGAAGWKAAA